ncbi:hypothetical protein CMEL01_03299 [Colletotrichum melonis]|uniref:Uncharacterized protein n=1 Tax=Colletotrichum melonis TaxID=1209925 RepID=A0AAI9XTW4_9PEZI|nr:hypothetical protein CMEL01_03299 [Colletotrichum melonis]
MAANDNRGNADGTQSRVSTVPESTPASFIKVFQSISTSSERDMQIHTEYVQSTVHVLQGDCALGPSHLTFPGTHLLRKD